MMKQLLAVLVCCVVSVGCVAEEVKPISPPPTSISDKNNQSEPHDSLADGIVVDAGSDSKLSGLSGDMSGVVVKNENNELIFSGVITRVMYECHRDGPCLVLIGDIAVSFDKADRYGGPYMGQVFLPDGINRRNIQEVVGMHADVMCFEVKPWEKFSKRKCTLSGKKEYFLKVSR